MAGQRIAPNLLCKQGVVGSNPISSTTRPHVKGGIREGLSACAPSDSTQNLREVRTAELAHPENQQRRGVQLNRRGSGGGHHSAQAAYPPGGHHPVLLAPVAGIGRAAVGCRWSFSYSVGVSIPREL
jgi:hypothetical protein